MPLRSRLPDRVTTLLVYGRLPLVFGAMFCAVAVMWNRNPVLYTVGVVLLFVAMSFDLLDGWFAARFHTHPTLAPLADRIMDKVVYSMIFPVVAAGAMWRLVFVPSDPTRGELLHGILVVLLAVAVLIRDNFAAFMRSFALRRDQEPEASEFTRLRTVIAAPVAALLYAHVFFVPEGPPSRIYFWISWLGNIPLQWLFVIEIILLTVTFGSIAGYCRRYGGLCLDEICLGDEWLRRRILSFFPNALTVMNAIMGLLAVFFAYQTRVREAYLLLIGAALFDKLDGTVARRLGLTDPLPEAEAQGRISIGGLMDDIADAISFCLAPAWIFYIVARGMAGEALSFLPVGLAALAYIALGIARLIYFTVDRNPIPGFFKGLPTPAAALLVVAPMIMFARAAEEGTATVAFWGVFCFALMIAAALLMNLYPVRYLHLGRFMSRKPWFARLTLFLLLSVFTPYFGHGCFIYMVLYVLSPLVTRHIDPSVAARESRPAKSNTS